MIKEIREPLIFEVSSPGKRAGELPPLDVPEAKELLAGVPLRAGIEGFPEVSETEITRHFTRLSQKNYCVDLGLYPLGSCTMKYNPKVNERLSAHPAFAATHPLASSRS
jgi:glycine dehydrogenase subunit 2